MNKRRQRIAILVSGSGTNMEALASSIRTMEGAEVVGVICNLPGMQAEERARRLQLPFTVIPHREYESREHFERALAAQLEGWGVDWICLAGFMRVLTASFIEKFPNRIINIHPSLLPSFPGLHAIEQALEYGVKVTGCTIHFVTPEMDAGPIIAQATVPVLSSDDSATLGKRIQKKEHELYPAAMEMLLFGQWDVSGRVVRSVSHGGGG